MSRFPPQRFEGVAETLRSVLDTEPVEFALVHGSATEGRPFRDVDVAVFVNPQALESDDPFDVICHLADRIERAIHMPTDVHLLNHAPVGFAYWASRGLLVVNRHPDRLADWQEAIWGEYLEMETYRREFTRQILG